MPAPVEIVRGEGAYLRSADGRRIFDAISSWWVTLHGHGTPKIAQAIARQARTLEQVIFAGFTHEPAARLAEELVAILPPGLTRVFFSDDGSTAVEAAVKMALQYHANAGRDRPVIAALEHSYHGDTFGAMSVSGRGVFTEPFRPLLFNAVHLPDPTEGDTVAALDDLLEQHGEQLAALIVEPLLMGAGGMRMWDESVLRALRERTRASGVLLIADEVLTGFGRTGPLFACERAGVTPDIMCLSKGLTGGFLPLGATVATDAVFDAFLSDDRRRTLFHGHSYTANPISCAAARASIRLLDGDSMARRRAIETAHENQLDALVAHPLVHDTRVIGTVAALEIGGGDEGYLSPIGPRLAEFALERGVLLRPLGNVVYLMPPYAATAEDLAGAYAVIGEYLDTL